MKHGHLFRAFPGCMLEEKTKGRESRRGVGGGGRKRRGEGRRRRGGVEGEQKGEKGEEEVEGEREEERRER